MRDGSTASGAGRCESSRNGASHVGALLGGVLVCSVVLVLVSGVADPLVNRLREMLRPAPDQQAPKDLTASATSPPIEVPYSDASAGRDLHASASAPAVDHVTDPGALNREAIDALNEGDLDRAIRLLAEAVTAQPDEPTFQANLGEAYLRRARAQSPGDAVLALADYELALQFTEDRKRKSQIQILRDKAKAIVETEAEFIVEPTLHFTFKFDGTRDEILDGVEELKILLESTYQDYGDLFRHRPVEAGEERIEVVLYRADGFDRVTGLGDWAGGVFDGTIRVPADDLTNMHRVARLKDVLRHEVAHAFTQSIGGSKVPSWLNEGIAQWLESPTRRVDSVKIARARLAAARTKGGKELFPLDRLRGSLVSWSDKAEITRAYDQALAFTDYIAQQYGTDVIFEMAAACKAGGPEAASEKFRARILDDLSVVLGDFRDTLE